MGFLKKIGNGLSKVGKTLTKVAKVAAPLVAGMGGLPQGGSGSLLTGGPGGGAQPQSIFSTIGNVLGGAGKVGKSLSDAGCALGGCNTNKIGMVGPGIPLLGAGQGPAAVQAQPINFGTLLAVGLGVAFLVSMMKKPS